MNWNQTKAWRQTPDCCREKTIMGAKKKVILAILIALLVLVHRVTRLLREVDKVVQIPASSEEEGKEVLVGTEIGKVVKKGEDGAQLAVKTNTAIGKVGVGPGVGIEADLGEAIVGTLVAVVVAIVKNVVREVADTIVTMIGTGVGVFLVHGLVPTVVYVTVGHHQTGVGELMVVREAAAVHPKQDQDIRLVIVGRLLVTDMTHGWVRSQVANLESDWS